MLTFVSSEHRQQVAQRARMIRHLNAHNVGESRRVAQLLDCLQRRLRVVGDET